MGLEIIKEVYKKKSEEKERLRKRIVDDAFKALEKLNDEISFEEAYIFGSVTEPYRFGEYSDVDFAFRGLESDKLFYAVACLSGYLDREVNVVCIEDIHFSDKIIREGIKWKKR
ncbi:MAG TPA: hypothetical protein ENG83_09330 [Nitrospirae bacterium]|nr:hypothetical protein BMS3Abin06_01321 [bacterium BMS3Abin06]HDH12375.1 hypothetical protein [Nitrospirota bacterium]HDZ01257.1 hypothetical protein [Nitrospirota bacterium]